MKPTPESDRLAYELAKGYLSSLNISGVTQELIEKYMNPLSLNPKPKSKEDLYRRMLISAQNAHMKTGVIGNAIGGVDKLGAVLYDFNPKDVLKNYGDDWEAVLDRILEELQPHGQVHKTPRSIWPNYCRTILSAVEFIEQFDSADDFFGWVDLYDRDERARASLPLFMDQEIDGFGFALSCDFLKEIGYVNFPKPDIHLRDIFTAIELFDGGGDYHLFKSIIRVARHAGVTPYNADKVFWLIGSGNFYRNPEIGSNGSINSRKLDFIEFARPKLIKNK